MADRLFEIDEDLGRDIFMSENEILNWAGENSDRTPPITDMVGPQMVFDDGGNPVYLQAREQERPKPWLEKALWRELQDRGMGKIRVWGTDPDGKKKRLTVYGPMRKKKIVDEDMERTAGRTEEPF